VTTFNNLATDAESEANAEGDRENDVALLRSLLDEREEIGAEHYEAFDDMLDRLTRNPARFPTLTSKQREYAENVADRHGISFARRPSQRAENVVRGREVKAPSVLSPDNLKAALNARKGRP
jgi:phosphoglycolate phosphatase-like HAD superfamily hydrolase